MSLLIAENSLLSIKNSTIIPFSTTIQSTTIQSTTEFNATTANNIMNFTCNSHDFCNASQASLPPIFVLNLDRAKDRWRNTVEVFRDAGFEESELNRLPAIDGRKLSEKDLMANSTFLARYLQPRGVIGCYLSHRTFWQLTVDRNYSSAIIVEDDIHLIDGFRDQLQVAMNNLCEESVCGEGPVDVALLGALGRVHPDGHDTLATKFFAQYMGGSRPLKKLSKNIFQPIRAAGTHGYLVTREGAQKLLSLCPKAVFHIDLDAWRHKSLKIVMFHPVLVYQTFDSTSLTDFPTSSLSSPSTVANIEPGHSLPSKMKATLVGSDAINSTRFTGGFSLQKTATSVLSRRLRWLVADPYTHQPISHVLDEPLIQFGPGGPVLTVGRHAKIFSVMLFLASYFSLCGQRFLSKLLFGGAVGFAVSIRSLIWLLMNWKD